MRDILKNKYSDVLFKARAEVDHPRNTFSFKNKSEIGKQKELLNLLKPRKTSLVVKTDIQSFDSRKKMNMALDEYFGNVKGKSILIYIII